MKHQTPEEYVSNLFGIVEENRGKNGVTRLRKVVAKCEREYFRYKYEFSSKSYNQPSDKWLHRKGIKQSNRILREKERWDKGFETIKEPYKYKRGDYNEIVAKNTCDIPYKLFNKWISGYKKAIQCIADIENQGFDEHGGWESGAEFDKHGRGSAISTDVYGIDEKNNLFVVQVRQYEKRYKNGFSNTRKNYFLIGYNENGNPFAHPIPANTVHAAIKKDPAIESAVITAQAWIWGIKQDKLKDVLRNGDVALIPVKYVPTITALEKKMVKIIDSHYVYSKDLRLNGTKLYALDPTLRHMKRQHPTQKGEGWFKIIIGKRASFHEFAQPTAD